MYNLAVMNRFVKTEYKTNENYSINHVEGYDIGNAFSKALHCDPCLTVAYFKKAKGKIKINGNRYEISDGDVILLNGGEIHCSSFDSEIYSERITLYINYSIADKYKSNTDVIFKAFYQRKNKLSSACVKKHGINKLIEEIHLLSIEQDARKSILADCRIAELAVRLSDCQSDVSAEEIHNPTIALVLEYIDCNFTALSDCTQIAQEFHLSKFHLSRLFKEHVGVSLWDYVVFKRILYVNDRIKCGEKIEAASYKAGFSNYSNFYRLYKKYMNMSPREYKDSIS